MRKSRSAIACRGYILLDSLVGAVILGMGASAFWMLLPTVNRSEQLSFGLGFHRTPDNKLVDSRVKETWGDRIAMRQDRARSFCVQVLQLNKHMGVFDVELTNSPEAELVAEGFESLGCKVAKDQFKPRLTVVPPYDKGT